MTYVKFRYIARDRDRHGNVRFYFRKPGKPKVRLRGLPGSEEFLAAYKAALGEHDPSTAAAEKSFKWLCERYYASAYFQSLEDYTKRRKRTVLDEIGNIAGVNGRKLGLAPYASMKKVHVRKLRDMKADTPEAANFRLKQITINRVHAGGHDRTIIQSRRRTSRRERLLCLKDCCRPANAIASRASPGYPRYSQRTDARFPRHHSALGGIFSGQGAEAC